MGLNFLKEINVKSLTIKYALVDVSFNDSFETLVAKMSEQGFELENTGNTVLLRLKNHTSNVNINQESGIKNEL